MGPLRAYRRAQAVLRRAQRRVARRKTGSGRRCTAVAQVQRLHLKVARQRRDFHHKTALLATCRYGLIAHEQLTITGIALLAVSEEHPGRGVGRFSTRSWDTKRDAGVSGRGRPAVRHQPAVLRLRGAARRPQDPQGPRPRLPLRLHGRPGRERGGTSSCSHQEAGPGRAVRTQPGRWPWCPEKPARLRVGVVTPPQSHRGRRVVGAWSAGGGVTPDAGRRGPARSRRSRRSPGTRTTGTAPARSGSRSRPRSGSGSTPRRRGRGRCG